MAGPQSSQRGAGRRGRRNIAEINMVPFIDVMLVLLIIFMVTAPLISPSVIELPSVGQASQQADRVVQVLIGKDDSLSFKTDRAGVEIPVQKIEQLAPRIQQALSQLPGDSLQTPVVISADKSVKYEIVVRVLDSLQRAGLARVGLSVQMAP